MKQKNETGLQAGIYRESRKKSAISDLIACVLIFFAFAALCHAAGRFPAMPWLLAAGVLTCLLCVGIRYFPKAKRLIPAFLAALLLLLLLARRPLLNGAGTVWNTLRDFWAERKGILLPLMETDGSGLWMAGTVTGVLLALLALLLSHVPMAAAAALTVLCVAAAIVQPDFLLLFSAGIGILLFSRLNSHSHVSAVSFLLVGAIVTETAVLALPIDTIQALSQSAKDILHDWRYEKGEEILPEGDLNRLPAQTESTDFILSVTVDTTQTLYLRGFVGDCYEDGIWTALDAETAAEKKDLFYWLQQSGFYPQSQLATAADLMGNFTVGSVSVRNRTGCSLYRYEPCTVLLSGAGVEKNKIRLSAVQTGGLRGERTYSFETVSDVQTVLPELLDFLQTDASDSVKTYLQMESAYREFVYSYALEVPVEFLLQMGAQLQQCCEEYGSADSLTKEQAQTAALEFLELCFDGSGDVSLPLSDTADGTTYQYATVAALALRYYGIPARYVEGYTVLAKENTQTGVDAGAAGAWVEVYQDGVGWLPLALTPGLEDLSAEQTESGVKPVGAGKEGDGDGPRVTEGQEPEQDDAETDNSENDTPEGGQRTALMRSPVFWTLLIMGILLLLLAAIVIRHALVLKKRRETFTQENPSAAVGCLFADCASLLAALGLQRGHGSMLDLCDAAGKELGAQYAQKLQEMTRCNAQALFSDHPVSEEQLAEMRSFHCATLDQLKIHCKLFRRLRLKWLSCLY